jgi:arylformamidase
VRWTPDFARPIDLAIPLRFDGPQPSFFTDTPASARPLQSGSYTGRVASGASCNCSVLSLAPHCHGTHTECIGHVSAEPVVLCELPVPAVELAALLTVNPERRGGERTITRAALASAAAPDWAQAPWRALVLRTLPNDDSKHSQAYRGPSPAAWFEPDAMHWVVEHQVRSLVVDLPSVDRADDGGALLAHRIFWGLPPGATDARIASRGTALITELAWIANNVADGLYALALQFPAFASDAAPSRPVLYPLLEDAR